MAAHSERGRTVVLTGGPCGGKSTFINELRGDRQERAHWLFVPEAAPLLFQAGLDAGTKHFQIAAVQLQIALEDACARAAEADRILLCHRGTLDPLAYWSRGGWDQEEFFARTMTLQAHLDRYRAVVHLRTAALGAESHYRRWPQAHRPESIAQAAEIDRWCESAWRRHPRHVIIECADDWPNKAQRTREALRHILSDPSH